MIDYFKQVMDGLVIGQTMKALIGLPLRIVYMVVTLKMRLGNLRWVVKKTMTTIDTIFVFRRLIISCNVLSLLM